MPQTMLLVAILLSSHLSIAEPGDIRLCEAYTRVNATLQCSDDNYLMRFGYKYCVKYIELEDSFQPETRVALAKIRSCLVTQLMNDMKLTCSNSEERAMEHHSKCYESGGFCSLSAVEKFKIGWVAKSEVKRESFRKTMLAVKERCDRSN